MSDSRADFAARWIEKAEHDLTNAEHTMTLPDSRCPFDTVAFHAQQCAEKYLKAFLVQTSRPFPKTHDLMALAELAGDDLPHAPDRADLAWLATFAVETRYPDDAEPVDRETALRAIGIARQVRKSVLETLPDRSKAG